MRAVWFVVSSELRTLRIITRLTVVLASMACASNEGRLPVRQGVVGSGSARPEPNHTACFTSAVITPDFQSQIRMLVHPRPLPVDSSIVKIRSALHLPAVDSNLVISVTTDSICQIGLAKYTELRLPTWTVTQVGVFAIGTGGFVVTTFEQVGLAGTLFAFFDSTWTHVGGTVNH